MIVKFLDKDYDIPNDVLLYVDLLAFTEDIKDNLIKTFFTKIKYSIDRIEDKDFLEREIGVEAGRFIAKLCENNIYNKTVNDYLNGNKGYEFFHTASREALNKIIALRKARNAAYEAGVQDAIYRKEASVTGLDFGIISGSFVNHMIYASMNASKEKEQEEAALKQYNKEIAELEKSVTSACEASEREYVDTVYIPSIKLSFTALVYGWLDSYIKDLIDNGRFDRTALRYVDLERSNDLLENLNLATNKSAILENAFLACPFNIAVYMKALYYELLDYTSFKTAKMYKQSEEILDFLRNNLGEISYPQHFKINYHCVELMAIFTEQPLVDVLHSLTKEYVSEIVSAYSNINKMLHNEDLCRKAIKGYAIEEILSGKSIANREANRRVKSIVSDSVWEQLVDKCGYVNLFDMIKNASLTDSNTTKKSDLDNLLIERLEPCLENARLMLVPIATKKKQEIEDNEKAQEAKRIKLAQKCNIIQVACKILLPTLIIVPLILRFVLVGIWCGDVKAFVNEHIETQLEEELAKSDSYANKIGLTGKFEVNKIEYYKEEYIKSITVVPHVTIYSSEEENFYTSYADNVLRYLNYDDTETIARPWYIANDEWNPSVNFHITVVCEDGSKVTCYENYEEDDTRFFAYLPLGVLIIFAVYSVIVVIVIKKIKRKYVIENLQKNN